MTRALKTSFKRPQRAARKHAIPVRFSDSEHATLARLASSSGVSVAAFLRDHFGASHILHQAIERRREALRNLWNANLEMIADWVRSYKTLQESARVIAHLQILNETLSQVLNLWDGSIPSSDLPLKARLENAPRKRVVRVRVSEADYKSVHEKAGRRATSASALLREHFATVRIRERPLEQKYNDLLKQWNANLNQIAHWVNRYQGSAPTKSVITRLASLEHGISLFAEGTP